jgi:hypothetical protein
MDAAEKHSKTVLYLMNALEASTASVSSGGDTIDVASPGMYMLWLMVRNDERRLIPAYPTYVGYTARPLAERIYEHIKCGKIAELFSGLNTDTGLPASSVDYVNVVYVPIQGVAAAMLEGLFLSTFDFAQNSTMNGKYRSLQTAGGQEAVEEILISDVDAWTVSGFRDQLGESLGIAQGLVKQLNWNTGKG